MPDKNPNAKNSQGAYLISGEVEAESGLVSIDGPGNVAITLTPDAAIELSERLLHAGLTAQGQRREAGSGGGTAD